jgi:hypothetical protein
LLRARPAPLGDPDATAACFAALAPVELPFPGGGHTLARWQALAAVGHFDLGVAKLYESHTDAVAILAELDTDSPPPTGRWAVWAAESPGSPVRFEGGRLGGEKAWCSGGSGDTVTHALVTCTGSAEERLLAAVEMPTDRRTAGAWASAGMAGAGTVRVCLDGVPARVVGEPDSYLSRPGFWQGGAGVAACWFGAATALAQPLRAHVQTRRPDPLSAARLGEVDVTLTSTAALIRAAAEWIDAHPRDDAQVLAARVRSATERCCRQVLDVVARVLGPGPLATDRELTTRMADLGLFIRQHHADRDLADLGRLVAADPGWAL